MNGLNSFARFAQGYPIAFSRFGGNLPRILRTAILLEVVMRRLVGMTFAVALAILPSSSAYAQSNVCPTECQPQGQPPLQCPNDDICNSHCQCVEIHHEPHEYHPHAGEVCGHWCTCQEGQAPAGNGDCTPCSTSSGLICYDD